MTRSRDPGKRGAFKRCRPLRHPAEAIVQAAKDAGVDLIVLGSHGRGALGQTARQRLGVIHRDVHISRPDSQVGRIDSQQL